MRAALNGDAARAELLLRRGAAAGAADPWGTTALMLAASRGHHAVVRLLLANDCDRAEVDARDSCGRTALMATCLAGAYTHMANSALARTYGFSSAGALQCARELLAAGAEMDARDE